jgi:hypothetical protein
MGLITIPLYALAFAHKLNCRVSEVFNLIIKKLKTMINIPTRPVCTNILIPRLAGKTLWISQAPHNPRNINAVAGAMGIYSGRREARIGWLNNQPVTARRLMGKQTP